MARLCGRSLRGARCLSAIPHGHWKTTTFVGGLRLGGITAPMVLDGPMDLDESVPLDRIPIFVRAGAAVLGTF